jgi:FkbM family methyltransferase
MLNPNALINSDHGPIIINIHDTIIAKHISRFGYWSKDEIDLIKRLLDFLFLKKDFLVFYDVGANIGTHSLAIGKTYGSKIKVRAFEAQRQIFNMLCGTVAINGLDNIYCHNLAVSDKQGKSIQIPLPDYRTPNNFGGLELIPPTKSDNQDLVLNGSEEVSTITLDSFNETVDFIKMDIEGMEDKALAGSNAILEKHRPIVFIEIGKTDFNYIMNLFRKICYVGCIVKERDLIAIPFEHKIGIADTRRVI